MNISCKGVTRLFQIMFTINILVIFLFIIRISGLAERLCQRSLYKVEYIINNLNFPVINKLHLEQPSVRSCMTKQTHTHTHILTRSYMDTDRLTDGERERERRLYKCVKGYWLYNLVVNSPPTPFPLNSPSLLAENLKDQQGLLAVALSFWQR